LAASSVLLHRVAALLTCVEMVYGNVILEINFCIMTEVKIVTANQP